MKQIEQAIQDAFNDMRVSPEMKEQTLDFINQHSTDCESTASDQDRRCEQESPEIKLRNIDGDKNPSRKRSSLLNGSLWKFAIAACLIVFAIGFGGFKIYNTETAFIDIEVNPSIELGVNIFDRVISEKALNADGQAILDDVSLVGMSYDDAMTTLTNNSVFLSYISEEAFIEVNVTSDNASQTAQLMSQSNHHINALPCQGGAHHVSKELYDEATGAGMGVGRYTMTRQLMELDPSVTLEECKSLTMAELRNRIAQSDPEHADETQQQGHGSGQDSQENGKSQGHGSGQGSQGQGQGQHRGGNHQGGMGHQ